MEMSSINFTKTILEKLNQEQIMTCENNPKVGEQLSYLRDKVFERVYEENYPVKAMTAGVAVTHFKLAACQELVQRFVFEYLRQTRCIDVNIVLAHNINDLSGDNHCFCVIGNVQANQQLLNLQNGTLDELAAKTQYFISLSKFLQMQNKDSVIVDPLLHLQASTEAGSMQTTCEKILDYAERHQITHITGVRKFNHTILNYVDQAKQNIPKLIRYIERDMLQKVLETYKVNPNEFKNSAAKEQAFRRAAFYGMINDLAFLLSVGCVDIDAQDNNPKSRKTALHIAISRSNQDKTFLNSACFLLKQGARIDIEDAAGKTVEQLIEESPYNQSLKESMR